MPQHASVNSINDLRLTPQTCSCTGQNRSDHCRSIKVSIILCMLSVDSFFAISIALVANRVFMLLWIKFCSVLRISDCGSCAHIHSCIQTYTASNHTCGSVRCGSVRAQVCSRLWIVRILLPTHVGQLCVSSDGGRGTWLNNIRTMTIFSERGIFSALFNAKTNVIQWIMWFLCTSKQTVHTGQSILVAKKLVLGDTSLSTSIYRCFWNTDNINVFWKKQRCFFDILLFIYLFIFCCSRFIILIHQIRLSIRFRLIDSSLLS